MELRQELELRLTEAVELCGTVLREEQQQLVRQLRQLEVRDPIVEGVEEVHVELQELRDAIEELSKEPKTEAASLLRTVEARGEGLVKRGSCESALGLVLFSMCLVHI